MLRFSFASFVELFFLFLSFAIRTIFIDMTQEWTIGLVHCKSWFKSTSYIMIIPIIFLIPKSCVPFNLVNVAIMKCTLTGGLDE